MIAMNFEYTFVILTSILISTQQNVKYDLLNQENEYEILDFMISYLKTMLGMDTSDKTGNGNGKDGDNMSIDSIDDLSFKVDELMKYVASAYFKDNPTFLNDFQRKQEQLKKRKTDSIMTA